jgi:hypothetical protein
MLAMKENDIHESIHMVSPVGDRNLRESYHA